MGRYWLVLGGTGPVDGSTGWCLVVLGQYGLHTMERNWLVHDGTWSVKGRIG